jgi:hypothetical protein
VPADGSPVTVTLADGTEPEVHRVGYVWAAEWVSRPQAATAYYPDGPRQMPFDRSGMMVPGPRYK